MHQRNLQRCFQEQGHMVQDVCKRLSNCKIRTINLRKSCLLNLMVSYQLFNLKGGLSATQNNGQIWRSREGIPYLTQLRGQLISKVSDRHPISRQQIKLRSLGKKCQKILHKYKRIRRKMLNENASSQLGQQW